MSTIQKEKRCILVSACLMGKHCRYDGGHNLLHCLDKLKTNYTLISFCPEQAGGLETPREPCEITAGRVLTKSLVDLTDEFVRGAKVALEEYRRNHCIFAILKERSPSCGSGLIYDGSFSGTLVAGYGITASLFLHHGIKVYGEAQIIDGMDALG